MEEVNETALTELVDETIGVQESTFDYSDVNEKDKNTLQRIVARKGVIIHATIVEIGGDLKEAQSIYAKNGVEGRFIKWVEEEYGMPNQTAYRYINAYNVLTRNSTISGGIENLSLLGVTKLSLLAKLPEEQQSKVINNAPLNEINTKEFEQLTKKVKETGEYNEQLLNEIRQEKENSKKTSEQKDAEIKKLQERVQELENVQPVAQTEPTEKIVEVEKIVEKKVIPDYIQQKLEELKIENKRLEEENDRKISFIQEQKQQLLDKDKEIENLNISTNKIPENEIPMLDLGLLFKYTDDFLKKSSGFALLKGQYENLSDKTKTNLINIIKDVENWCLLMKQAVNGDSKNVGNNIIIESEEE